MTHDELLEKIESNRAYLASQVFDAYPSSDFVVTTALRSVVELHKPSENYTGNTCGYCFVQAYEPSGLEMMDKDFAYPCATIRAIEKELG
jgi:hypothetical protein